METFCEKHMLPKRLSDYVVLIAEEVLCLQTDFSDINISLSYSEKDGSLEIICESTGKPFNPLVEALDDNIGLKLILGRCKSVDYRFESGKNIMNLKVKGE